MSRPSVATLCLLCLAACSLPQGRADGDAMAGFRTETASAVTLTAPVAWVTRDGEIMLSLDGKPTPVWTGLLRQPVAPGTVVTVTGWQEPGGRRRVLAQRIVTTDGRQVFP